MKFVPYSRRMSKRRAVGLITLVAVPLLLGSLVGVAASSLSGYAMALNDNYCVDISALLAGNFTRLAEIARIFEYYLTRDHLPLNYTLSALWDENFTSIKRYIVSGDAAIWTGMTLAMAAYRYAVAARKGTNETEITRSLALVRQVAAGVSLLLAVPNGGIGPEFPGVLARGVSPKNWSDDHPPISGFDYTDGADNLDVFNGAGAYEDWLWIGYPSLDQYSGIIMGVTTAALLVDDPWVSQRMKDLAAQILEHFRASNWYLTDAHQRTTGQTFQWRIEHPGFWVLATLFMGKVTDPATYEPLYLHWAFERGYATALALRTDLSIFTLFNYFSMNINWVVLHTMAAFETDPVLKAKYEKVLSRDLYPPVSNHRNAWFNVAYLQASGIRDDNVQRDIVDQLMRFDLPRIAGQPNTTRVPERGLNGSGALYHDLVPATVPRSQFSDWLATHPAYALPGLLVSGQTDSEYLAAPKTVDQYQAVDFLWQRSPWRVNEYSPAARQDSGLSFLLPYYIGRYISIIPGGAS